MKHPPFYEPTAFPPLKKTLDHAGCGSDFSKSLVLFAGGVLRRYRALLHDALLSRRGNMRGFTPDRDKVKRKCEASQSPVPVPCPSPLAQSLGVTEMLLRTEVCMMLEPTGRYIGYELRQYCSIHYYYHYHLPCSGIWVGVMLNICED